MPRKKLRGHDPYVKQSDGHGGGIALADAGDQGWQDDVCFEDGLHAGEEMDPVFGDACRGECEKCRME